MYSLIGILRHWLPSLAFLFLLKVLARWRWMSAWFGHGPRTDERNKHGLTLKIKKFRQPFESQSSPPHHHHYSLPLVLYLFSFTARIDIRNWSCLVPVHQERVIFMNRQNKSFFSFSRPRSKLCNPDFLSFFDSWLPQQIFIFAYFGLLATWPWLRKQMIHDSFPSLSSLQTIYLPTSDNVLIYKQL